VAQESRVAVAGPVTPEKRPSFKCTLGVPRLFPPLPVAFGGTGETIRDRERKSPNALTKEIGRRRSIPLSALSSAAIWCVRVSSEFHLQQIISRRQIAPEGRARAQDTERKMTFA